MTFSRRAVLLQGTALAFSTPFVGALASVTSADEAPEIVVGFTGENTVQLTIVDTLFNVPEVVPVAATDRLKWSPDPFDSYGSVGRLNGEAGYFSGDVNVSQPQEFTAWPEVIRGTRLSGFREDRKADQPGRWRVSIDGARAEVISVYRKTVPIRTLSLGKHIWESTKRHQLTLVLDRVIPDGAVVTLEGPSVSEVEQRKSSDLFSEAVHVCQAGYPLDGPKKAYVGAWWGHDNDGQSGNTDAVLSQPTSWSLVSVGDGSVVRKGSLMLAKPGSEPHRKEQNFNGCDIFEADFSDLDLEGEYEMHVDGFGVSFPFRVVATPYEEALRLAARWYFHQRSGCEIAEPYGEGRTRPRNGHPEDGLTVWKTNVKLGSTSEGYGKGNAGKILAEQPIGAIGPVGAPKSSSAEASPNAWGGWHDAGDWDRRIQHMDAVYHMAHLVETFEYAQTLHLNLPESGKPFAHPDVQARKSEEDQGDGQTILPDLIHEALWGISLWRRTQTEDGGIIGGVEYSNSGVFGSVSWNPVQIAYAYQEEDWASYVFAISAAKLGHVIKTVCGDAALGDALIEEAVKAWYWAEQEFLSGNPYGGDPEAEPDPLISVVSRARVAAAAGIFRASGDATARAVYEDNNPFVPQAATPAGGIKKEVFQFSNFEYVLAEREGQQTNPLVVSAIRKWIKNRALKGKRMGRDYGLHNTQTYPWGRGWLRFGPGSNWRAAHFALYFSDNQELPAEMHAAAVEGMWFGLGCNSSNTSFVQGLGHRDFADPLYKDGEGKPPIPGQISFGVAGGKMHKWEKQKTEGSIYPPDQDAWPIYAQIFESTTIAISAEHDMKANVLEWLVACATVNLKKAEPSQ